MKSSQWIGTPAQRDMRESVCWRQRAVIGKHKQEGRFGPPAGEWSVRVNRTAWPSIRTCGIHELRDCKHPQTLAALGQRSRCHNVRFWCCHYCQRKHHGFYNFHDYQCCFTIIKFTHTHTHTHIYYYITNKLYNLWVSLSLLSFPKFKLCSQRNIRLVYQPLGYNLSLSSQTSGLHPKTMWTGQPKTDGDLLYVKLSNFSCFIQLSLALAILVTKHSKRPCVCELRWLFIAPEEFNSSGPA